MVDVTYGKSMYGGWYAEYWSDRLGRWVCIAENTLTQLTKALNLELGMKNWRFIERIDN